MPACTACSQLLNSNNYKSFIVFFIYFINQHSQSKVLLYKHVSRIEPTWGWGRVTGAWGQGLADHVMEYLCYV